jgi:hypothetical protein
MMLSNGRLNKSAGCGAAQPLRTGCLHRTGKSAGATEGGIPLMPFPNGRFYMNPIFGAALERARKANAGREWSEESPEASGQASSASKTQHRPAHAAKASGAKHKGHTGDDYDPAATTEGIANQIYNETAGLRTTAHQGPGSDVDLQDARRAISHVIHNRAAAGMTGGLANPKLRPREEHAIAVGYPAAYDAYGESQHAARLASGKRDSSGAVYFYLDHGQGAPPFAAGQKPVAVYGPFKNMTPPKGVAIGAPTMIKVFK